ncbi:hypothetical protein L3X38_044582 [Prunus dulcis]|uniref:Uncharacterized protein n=1 Tax=Prunus dulcis TaxID=3755 RepID=A0AAD4V0Q3_PRUDU|nr:hypothetical protein L3X38_044582 [Prunus dulcis]
MEEVIGNVAGARQIYERWMNWMPDQQAWLSFIKFELHYNEVERARAIFERFVQCHPKVGAWIRYAKFEMKNGEVARARNVYERAVEIMGDDEEAEQLFVAFVEFEERCKESDGARRIYKFALDHLPKRRVEDLYKKFVGLEKIREVYERAIANVPPVPEKRYWQRYIYLWINYALYEELDAGDMERARDVYRECLQLTPHKKFSFAKIWLLAAGFEIRQLNLEGARKILGTAIGKSPKDKIFKKYIEIELNLGNFDRCRKLNVGDALRNQKAYCEAGPSFRAPSYSSD